MKSANPQKAWRIRADLDGVWPPVWRRFVVSDSITLLELHEVIQEMFGWQDYHLHEYTIRGVEYGDPENDEYGDRDLHDETTFTLRQLALEPGESFTYVYDFGDNWHHTLLLEKIVDVEGYKRLPRCLAGARACPPEDVGGIGGYAEFVEALADPEHPEHERYATWVGAPFDPEAFQPKDANRRLRDRAAAARAPEWGRVSDRERSEPLAVPADWAEWNEADRKKHEITAGELPLRRDVVAFLGYLRENKVTGTTSRGNLPLKHVAAVAAGFVDPPAMELRFGTLTYPVRSEEEVWPVYFVHMLANGANLISGGPGRRWRLSERGVQYLNASPVVQVRTLLAGWFFQADWTLTLAYDIFGGSLPSWVPQSVLYLLREIEGGQRAEYDRFIGRLIEKVGWRLEGDSAEELRKELGLSVERMVVRPLEAMGVLTGERVKDEESPFPREKLAAFSLTRFGATLLDTMGPWGK